MDNRVLLSFSFVLFDSRFASLKVLFIIMTWAYSQINVLVGLIGKDTITICILLAIVWSCRTNLFSIPKFEHICIWHLQLVLVIYDFFSAHREIIETMVQAYSQKIFNNQKPVFDGRRNLYSRDMLPIGREKVREGVNNSNLIWPFVTGTFCAANRRFWGSNLNALFFWRAIILTERLVYFDCLTVNDSLKTFF